MTTSAIDSLIAADRESRKRLSVVGERMLDIYCHGSFGVCQEDAMKFVEESRVEVPGGAANAARQLRNWNASVAMFGQVATQSLIQPIKTRYLVNGKFVFRHDLDEMDCETALKEARKAVMKAIVDGKPDGILLSDYHKGFLTVDFIRQLIGYAKFRNIPIVSDAKQMPAIYDGSILKTNISYAREWEKFFQGFQGHGIITYGHDSPLVCEWRLPDSFTSSRPTLLPPVPCVCHVGAGDCFASHLLLALVHGLSIDDAAAIAHSAGRVYVQHPHGRPPWPHEIRKDIDPCRGKVVPKSDLAALRQSIPGTLVCTNGCYDLLHAGHLHTLQEARRMGDQLVVLVNDDASVRRLKGPGRPIVPLAERMAMLAALDCVDWVCLFEEDTPAELLAVLKPNVRVKGAATDLNGAGDEHCGEVRLVPLMAGWSTTETIGRIRNGQ